MDMKATLCRYLKAQREIVLWKVEGVPERDLRMPMTSSGTNLLGLVKHLAGLEAGYFGGCLGRPYPDPLYWTADDAEPNSDMWATADESPGEIIVLYRKTQEWADATIAGLPLDAPGHVPWWNPPETDLHRLLVHMVAETAHHAGHMDILRESIDGARGMLPEIPNLPDVDESWWPTYVAHLRTIAESSAQRPTPDR